MDAYAEGAGLEGATVEAPKRVEVGGAAGEPWQPASTDPASDLIGLENLVAPEDKLTFAAALRVDAPGVEADASNLMVAEQIEAIGKNERAFICGKNDLFPSEAVHDERDGHLRAAQWAAEARTGAMIEAQKGLKGILFGPGSWEVDASFKAAEDPLGRLNEDMNISWQAEGLPEDARVAAAAGARRVKEFHATGVTAVEQSEAAFAKALDEKNGGEGEYLVSRAVAHRMKETLWSIAPVTTERAMEKDRLLGKLPKDEREQMPSHRLQALAQGISGLVPEGEQGHRSRLDLECANVGIGQLAAKEAARWAEEKANTIPAMKASVRDMDDQELKVEEWMAVGREVAASRFHDRTLKALDREIIQNPHPERYLSLHEAKNEFKGAGVLGAYSQQGLDASRQMLGEGLIRHPGQSAAVADARLTAVANHMWDQKLISKEVGAIEDHIGTFPVDERLQAWAQESAQRNKGFVEVEGQKVVLDRETKGAWAALSKSLGGEATPNKQAQEAGTIRRAAGVRDGDDFIQAAVCEKVAQKYGEEAQRVPRQKEAEKIDQAFKRKSRTEHMVA